MEPTLHCRKPAVLKYKTVLENGMENKSLKNREVKIGKLNNTI